MNKKTNNIKKSELIMNNEKILEDVDKKTKELNDEAIEIHRKISLLL